MTGTAAAVRSSERRDPSPSAVQRNDSSSTEEEPWDQRPAGTTQENIKDDNKNDKNTMRTYRDDVEDDLEDGELPSLTRKGADSTHNRMGGRIVNGQRTTTRPLSPPSTAGLVNKAQTTTKGGPSQQQRKFWGQMDVEDSEGSMETRERSDEDGPDDEVAARRAMRRRELEQASRQGDETIETDETGSWALTRTFDSTDDQDNTFCGQTLNAIGDMCGDLNLTGASEKRITAKESALKKKLVYTQPTAEKDEQEEHTAIEVEFVEPARKSGRLSPQSKNAYLTALAKKAKEDFQKTKAATDERPDSPARAASPPRSVSPLAERMDETPDDDVYKSFDATEKRKFLKLINSGLSPSEASQCILEERSAKEEAKAHQQEQQHDEKEVSEAAGKKKMRGSRLDKLAFWRKPNASRSADETENKAEHTGVARDVAPPEIESEPTSKAPNQNEEEFYDGGAAVVESSGKAEPYDEEPDQYEAAPKILAVVEKKGDTTTTTVPETDVVSTEEPNHFARSGINYYDAVRREDTEDDSSFDRAISPVPSKDSAGKTPHRRFTHRGFAPLKDGRAKSAPRAREDAAYPPAAVPASVERRSKEVESTTAGTLAISEATTTRQVASASKNSNKVTPEDIDTLEKMERELLRPIQKDSSTVGATTSRTTGSVNSMSSTPLRGVPAAKKTTTSDKADGGRIEIAGIHEIDVGMDTYPSSTDVYSSAAGHQDSSVFTAGTGASTYTQSSRVRRPGAAKQRLAKAKRAQNARGKGWHESIRAAAASTNRVWEPKAGWVDYEEPSANEIVADTSQDKLHIDLQRSFRSRKENGESGKGRGAGGKPIPVPFPSEWERERHEMIEAVAPMGIGKELGSHAAAQEGKKSDQLTADTDVSIEDASASKPQGWVESMRKASAALENSGQTWDPQKGWTSVQREKTEVSDDTDNEDADYSPGAHDDEPTIESDEVVAHSEKASPTSSPDRDRRRETETSGHATDDSMDREPRLLAIPLPPRDTNKKLNQWIAKAEQSPKNRSELSAESSDRAVASAGTPTERYMQLGDSGSARSSTPDAQQESFAPDAKRDILGSPANQSSSAVQEKEDERSVNEEENEREDEDDMAPLLSQSGAFPSVNDRPISPVLDIVKDKAGEEDMDFFAQQESLSRQKPALIARTTIPFHSEPPVQSEALPDGIVKEEIGTEDMDFFTQQESTAKTPSNQKPSLQAQSTAPTPSGQAAVPSVDIVKEKFGEEDMDLFSQQESTAKSTGSHLSSVRAHSIVPALGEQSVQSGGYSTRRGAGPVDIDEVDGQAAVPSVDIVKEKVGEEDMDLFSQQESTAKSTGSHRPSVRAHSIVPAHGEQSVQSGGSSARRGAGPVDVDEVDDSWDSEDETRYSVSWIPDASADSRSGLDASADSRSGLDGSADSRSGGSGSATSLPTKKVPKLKRSVRDTTPIRGRKNASTSMATPETTDDSGRNDDAAAVETAADGGHDNAPDSLDSQPKTMLRSTEKSEAVPVNHPVSPGLKARLQQFESHGGVTSPRTLEKSDDRRFHSPTQEKSPAGTAEWKSFLGKKVRAESAAAERQRSSPDNEREPNEPDHRDTKEPEGDKYQYQSKPKDVAGVGLGYGYRTERQREEDSLFQFNDIGRTRGVERHRNTAEASALDLSDVSSIRPNEDQDDGTRGSSEANGPEEGVRQSFLKRLSECAAPILGPGAKDPNDAGSMPTAHLAFMRSSPQASNTNQSSSRFLPTSLCGRPDVTDESLDASFDPTEESTESGYVELRKKQSQRQRGVAQPDDKPRSRSAPKTRAHGSEVRVSTSSVVSDDFGAKTAYLEAIAMRTAVSNPRRSDSRRRARSSASSETSSSTVHSEKWKAFLERKRAAGASPVKSRASSTTEVSKAAEKYAAEKVEEMMSRMASNSRSNSRSRDRGVDDLLNTSGEYHEKKHGQHDDSDQGKYRKKADSVRAAEDLAAARVEAMMAALSSTHLDEAEI